MAALLVLPCLLGTSPDARAQSGSPSYQLDIRSADLMGALEQLGERTGLTILYDKQLVAGKKAPVLSGEMKIAVALDQLLAHSGLAWRFVNERTVVLKRAEPKSHPTQQPDGASERNGALDEPVAALEEIVVTAEKRTERLQDVPVPVSVIDTGSLSTSNQWKLQDYATSVPGLSVSLSGQTKEQLSIRGVTTGPGLNPTVGVVIDDVPYGAATDLVGANAQPNFDPSDLVRIEVLRGPQGTLYGASSMGGLVKYVTVDPSTAGWSGRVEAGTLAVHNGDGPGYNVDAAVNVPINDTLAVRASGFTRKDPGYIDDRTLGLRGVNWAEISGGHLVGLWKPNDSVALKVSALYQLYRGGGTNDADPTLGNLQQFFARGVGPYDRTVQAYSATLTAKLGAVELTSISGYNINNVHDTSDYSPYLGVPLIEPKYGVTGLPLYDHYYAKKLSQELRLAGALGDRFEWTVGGFYTHEDSQYHSDAYAADLLTGVPVADVFIGTDPVSFVESAAFGNLTYHFTDQFNIQVGGRESRITQTFQQTEIGTYLVPIIYGVASPFVFPETRIDNSVFTYLVTPQFRFSTDLMAYARFASGYRAGGINVSQGVGTPIQYDPDRTYDYELGVKGDFLGHTLSIDASVYYIQWQNLQISLTSPVDGANYLANGSAAKSEGVEISVESRPLKGLTLSGWVDYDDAALTKNFPADSTAHGFSGNPLPFNARWSGHFAFQQEFPLGRATSGYFGAQASYVSQRLGVFTPTPVRQVYPGFAQVDLRAGLHYEAWTANLYANNLADKRGEIGGGLGSFSNTSFYYIQPRTLGLSLSRTF